MLKGIFKHFWYIQLFAFLLGVRQEYHFITLNFFVFIRAVFKMCLAWAA